MSIARIVWLVSAIAAVALAFVDSGYNGTILAVLGLLSGWFLDSDHRRGVIIAGAFLFAGGHTALSGIEGIGEHLGDILAALTAVFGGASVMAIVRTLVERIMKGSPAT
ncbi:MAG: hypothetical protein HKN36_04485 [Hellea sp.]|nr:hypothetical protein [Hellea sp.]